MNRDEFPTCPRCATALDPVGSRLTCKACDGMLLTEAEVSKLIAEMLGTTLSMLGWSSKTAEPQPLKLVVRPPEGAAPTCPHCTTAMEPRSLYGIKVDRCEAHGIWFDREELEQALRGAMETRGRVSTVGEKVFAGVVGTAYIAAAILQLLVGR